MGVWTNLDTKELVIEPENQFEMSFLTSLLGDNGIMCTVMLSDIDNSVVGISIKSQKTLANEENRLTTKEIDEMYEELGNE